jgi:acetyl esterase/lipase
MHGPHAPEPLGLSAPSGPPEAAAGWACAVARAFSRGARGRDVPGIRQAQHDYLTMFGTAEGVWRDETSLAGVVTHRFVHSHADVSRKIVFAHGGGFTSGSGAAAQAMLGELSRACSAEVLAIDYRLAPENRFPAGLDDTTDALAAVIDDAGAANVAIVGGSAGGALAVGAVLRRSRARDDLPAAVALYSPLLDLSASSAAYDANETSDPMLSRRSVRAIARAYLKPGTEDDLASPLSAELSDFPDVLAFASQAEVLRDDAQRWVDRVAGLGRSAVCRLEPGLPHMWPVFGHALPQAMRTIEQTGEFVRQRLGAGPRGRAHVRQHVRRR